MQQPLVESQLVCIIIINWHEWELTIECLKSVSRLDWPKYRVLIIDNGSTNESVLKIESWLRSLAECGDPNVNHPDFRGDFSARCEVICNQQNLGFAGACNIGIQRAKQICAHAVWLLNNDTAVDPAALRELVHCSLANGNALVSSLVRGWRDQDGIWFEGACLDPWRTSTRHLRWSDFNVNKEKFRYLSGCSVLIPMVAIEEVGLFDERFFMYFEDVDYCIRASLSGFELRVCPSSVIRHVGSASSKVRSDFAYRVNTGSAVLFMIKHLRPAHIITSVLWYLCKAFGLLLLGRPRSASSVLKGAATALRQVGNETGAVTEGSL